MEYFSHTPAPENQISFGQRVRTFAKFMLEEIGKLDMKPQRWLDSLLPLRGEISGSLPPQYLVETDLLPRLTNRQSYARATDRYQL